MPENPKDKPLNKSLLSIGNATFNIAHWGDGGNTVQMQVDYALRNFVPTDKNPEPSEKQTNFKEFGQIDIYKNDAMGLISIARMLDPTLKITVEMNKG